MNKGLILVVMPIYYRSKCFIEDYLMPINSSLKQIDNSTFESDNYKIRLGSLSSPENIRGLRPDYIYLSNECTAKIYQEIMLPLVNGEHSRIKVVD